MNLWEEISACVEDGKDGRVSELVHKALDEGVFVREIMEKGIVPGMELVGRRFKDGQAYLPEVLIAARAAHAGLAILRPVIVKSGEKPKAKVIIGTVEGDLHDIGKNLVRLVLEGEGFEVIDLGVDVSPAAFQEKLKEEKADVLGMSALLTTTMVNIPQVIEGLKKSGLREGVKVIIGGAPITEEYAREVGADAYARDCFQAVDLVRSFIGG